MSGFPLIPSIKRKVVYLEFLPALFFLAPNKDNLALISVD